jgi:SOS-response transcriptional repressor LexA
MMGESGLMHESGDLIDLHVLLTNNSPNVVLVPVVTNIMRASGLTHGSIAIVDRGQRPKNGNLIWVRYNGHPIIRKLLKQGDCWYLTADNKKNADLPLSNCNTDLIGTVTGCILLLR